MAESYQRWPGRSTEPRLQERHENREPGLIGAGFASVLVYGYSALRLRFRVIQRVMSVLTSITTAPPNVLTVAGSWASSSFMTGWRVGLDCKDGRFSDLAKWQ